VRISFRSVLLAISILAALAAIGAWASWAGSMGVSDDVDFETSHRRTELLWRIIPGGLLVSVITGIAAAVVKDRQGSRSMTGAVVAIAAALIAAGIFWMVMHLSIS
jgi:hypothetical protein